MSGQPPCVHIPLQFYFSVLDRSFQMTVAGQLAKSYTPPPTTDAVVEFCLPLATVRASLQWASDSLDLNDLAASDLHYYVDGASSWPLGNLVTRTVTEQRIAVQNRPSSSVAHDFVAHMARQIFGNANMIDLFSNETALRQSIVTEGQAETARITAFLASIDQSGGTHPALETDAWGQKYFLHTTGGPENLVRVLLEAIAQMNPARLSTLGGGAGKRPIPLILDDTINFVMVLQPSAGQQLRQPSGEAVASRSYLVRMRMC